MSSSIRNIQRAAKRKTFFKGRGSKLGVKNPKAEDLLARQAREARRAEEKEFLASLDHLETMLNGLEGVA